ncbi:MAG: NAD(P)H-hydrate epimerase, partial [Planctomycetota bacterium]
MFRLRPYDPSMRHVSRAEIREIDRRAIEEFGVPVKILMENAGMAAADEAARMAPPGARVTVVCGKGNNGGDGFVAARGLREKGFAADLVLVDFARDDIAGVEHLAENYDRAIGSGAKIVASPEGDLVMDAMLGTGVTREVRGPAREMIDRINGGGPVLAVDLPSGLDADTGEPLGAAVRA